jgi:hypothetical protein
MEKIIPYDIRKSMTKKAYLEIQKNKRKMNGFNTGERLFDNKKHPSREKNKKNFQKELDKFLEQ